MGKEKLVEHQVNKNIHALTAGGQTAIVLCANSFRFGGNWGFIKRSKSDFSGILETLKTERPNVKALPVKNGALILCNENFLAHNVNLLIKDAIDGEFVDKAKQRKQDEHKRFMKFINSVAEGKNSHIKKGKDYAEIIVGVFCVNDTNAIRIAGEDYPAYKLTLIEALDYVNHLTKTGRKVYARAIAEDGKEVFGEVFKLATNSKGLAALYRGLEIADSETGLFLTLRIV